MRVCEFVSILRTVERTPATQQRWRFWEPCPHMSRSRTDSHCCRARGSVGSQWNSILMADVLYTVWLCPLNLYTPSTTCKARRSVSATRQSSKSQQVSMHAKRGGAHHIESFLQDSFCGRGDLSNDCKQPEVPHPLLKALSGGRAVLGDGRKGLKNGANQQLGISLLSFFLCLLPHQLQHLTDLLIATHLNKQLLWKHNGVM